MSRQSDISRRSLSRHKWALVAGVLLTYFHVISLNIPLVPYVPLTAIYAAIFALLTVFLLGCRVYPDAHLRLYRTGYQALLIVFGLVIVLMFALGYMNGNSYFHIWTELGFFLVVLFILLIGGHGRTWHIIDRPATIMVYVGFILMVVFKDTVAQHSLGTEFVPNARLTNTVAYGLRPILASAVFLFIWGSVNARSKFWKVLQIGTIVPYVISEVGFFQFRSSLVTALLAVILVLFVYPFLRGRRLRWGSYIVIALLSVASLAFLLSSEYWAGFMNRASGASVRQTSIFDVRNIELAVFLRDMGSDLVWGRGLGGTFDASSVFSEKENADRWRTVHYGVFSFVLRGGVFFLAIFLAFFLFVFRKRIGDWLDNPLHLASVLAIPIILFQIFTLPFLVSLAFMPGYLWFGLVLAMLGTKRPAPQGGLLKMVAMDR